MKTRFTLVIFLVVLSLGMVGCWDYIEYENMVQVTAVGNDFNPKTRDSIFIIQYIPTSKSSQMGGSGSSNAPPGKNPAAVHSARAKTIYEASSNLQQAIFKRLFYGYLRVYIIGADAARNDLLDIMELIDRTPLIRSNTYLLFTPGTAEDAISTFDAMSGSSSEEIFNLIISASQTGAAYPVTVQDFEAMLAVPGLEATAPRILTVSKESKPEPKGGTEDGIKYDPERAGAHRIAGLAVFKGAKLAGWMNAKESQGFGVITGKKSHPYKVSQQTGRTDTAEVLYYRISKSKSKIKVRLEDKHPAFEVNISVTGDLRKYYSNKGSDFLDPREVRMMEKKLADSVRSDVEAALKRGQKELKSDVFGFGFALFRENPKLWRSTYEANWDKVFPDVPIHIQVSAKIINTGSNLRKLEVK